VLLHNKLRDSGLTSFAGMKVRIAAQAGAINCFLNGAMQLNALHEFVGRYLLEHFPSAESVSE